MWTTKTAVPTSTKSVPPSKIATPKPKAAAPAPKVDEPAHIEDVTPYPFVMSEEKGRKAAVRFRENLRRHYTDLDLSEGLTIKDQPILHLFCYDHDTEIAYCRLWSSKHNGPIFPSVTELYNAYNLSQQGHPQDVFIYAGTDEDRGQELGAFLKVNQIRTVGELTPAQRKLFEDSVESNPIRIKSRDALDEKKKRKAAETNSKKRLHDGTTAADHEGGDGTTTPVDESSALSNEVKKKPGRPKGSSKEGSATKRSRSRSSKSSTSTPKPSNVATIPTGLTNVSFDASSAAVTNLDDITATVHYRREQVRHADLPVDSIERAALNWAIFSKVVATHGNALGVDPTQDAEVVLQTAISTGGAVDDGEGVLPIDIDQVDDIEDNMAAELEAALQDDNEEEQQQQEEE